MSALFSLGRLISPALLAVLALAPAPEKSPYTADSPAMIHKRLDEKQAVLLDVREKTEWDKGHLQQASLLPLSALAAKPRDKKYTVDALKKSLPTGKPIYLHCKAGGRCILAAEALRKELGPKYDFRPLKPGYEELVKAGFEPAPTETPED